MNFMVGNWLSVWQPTVSFSNAMTSIEVIWASGYLALLGFLVLGIVIHGILVWKKRKKEREKSNSPACTSGVGRLVWWGWRREYEWQAHLLPGMLVPPKPPFSPRPLSFGPLVLTCRLISMCVMVLSRSSKLSSHSFSWGTNACFRSLMEVQSQRRDHWVPTEGW